LRCCATCDTSCTCLLIWQQQNLVREPQCLVRKQQCLVRDTSIPGNGSSNVWFVSIHVGFGSICSIRAFPREWLTNHTLFLTNHTLLRTRHTRVATRAALRMTPPSRYEPLRAVTTTSIGRIKYDATWDPFWGQAVSTTSTAARLLPASPLQAVSTTSTAARLLPASPLQAVSTTSTAARLLPASPLQAVTTTKYIDTWDPWQGLGFGV
jgi:hypothetical protein